MSKLKLKKLENNKNSLSSCKEEPSQLYGENDVKEQKSNMNRKLIIDSENNGGLESVQQSEDDRISKYFKPNSEISSDLDDSSVFIHKKKRKSPKRSRKPHSDHKLKNNNLKKSNTLIDYAKSFEKVCTSSGVDVDPEELQLAIALSQSIADQSDENDIKKHETYNFTSANIKKTLEQFGFKVKSLQSNSGTFKRHSKYKRRCDYALISLSTEEKKQIITNKISQILLENLSFFKKLPIRQYVVCSNMLKSKLCISKCCFIKDKLSYRDTNDESTCYYVPNLISPSSSRVGCLLRDWSTIPGRDKSPEKHGNGEDFKSNPLFNDKFDLILTGTKNSIEEEIKYRKTNGNTDIYIDNPLFDLNSDFDKNSRSTNVKENNVTIPGNSENASPILINSPDIFGESCESLDCNISANVADDRHSNIHKSNEIGENIMGFEDDRGIVQYESFNDMSFNKIEETYNGNENSITPIQNSCNSIVLHDSDSDSNSEDPHLKIITENCSQTSDNVFSNCSRNIKNSLSSSSSEVFILSDDELEYSINKIHNKDFSKNRDLPSSSSEEELILIEDSIDKTDLKQVKLNFSETNSSRVEEKCQSKWYNSSILDSIHSCNTMNMKSIVTNSYERNEVENEENSTIVHPNNLDMTKKNISFELSVHNENEITCGTRTPDNSKYVIKMDNITPIMSYDDLSSPDLSKQLSKYGVKQLKRKKAVQILKHIYEQTHPVINTDIYINRHKRIKLDQENYHVSVEAQSTQSFCNLHKVAGKENIDTHEKDKVDLVETQDQDLEFFLPVREKNKVHGCSVPLHVAFRNYINSRNRLRIAMLQYEPINIEIIHKDLKAIGFNYKPKDIMKFMDKKCITIKTNVKEHLKCTKSKNVL